MTTLEEEMSRRTGYKLSEFQRVALKAIEEGNGNVIVVAPTGSGKSLVGYAALLKHGGGFYLAPLIALMNEKYRDIREVLGDFKAVVTNRDFRLPWHVVASADIKVMSPYKFLMYSSSAPAGDVVVVDEFHKMSDDALFEAAITLAKAKGMRIVALSATVDDEDLQKLSAWLNAKVVSSEERPVELRHYAVDLAYSERGVVSATDVYVNKKKPVLLKAERFKSREEAAATLAARLHITTGRPVIVWAPTRHRVEEIAMMIAQHLPHKPEMDEVAGKIAASNPSENVLKRVVRHGVFIHHGGLSYTVRDLVEREYRARGGVIVTAYTLSHGVNLPGTFLVFSTIRDYKGDILDASTFHQISGRAGRPGLDPVGIVVTVLLGKAEREAYGRIMEQKASKIRPALFRDTASLLRLMLTTYATSGHDKERVGAILRESFSFFAERDEKAVSNAIAELDRALLLYSLAKARFEGKVRNVQAVAEKAMAAGLLPDEFEILMGILLDNPSYGDAIDRLIRYACQSRGYDVATTAPDVKRYGFLASILGNPRARTVASDVQTLLEAAAYWAASAFGWKSREHEALVELAKKFAYAGNPRVEPLARELRVDALRRVLKAVPQVISAEPVLGEDAVRLAAVALKEIFVGRAPKPGTLKKYARLVLLALTKREPPDREIDAATKLAEEELLKSAKEKGKRGGG